jgi:hypothetical protein
VSGCYASGNWENGFYFDAASNKTNVELIGCTSENNGKDKVSPTYGAGFLVSCGVHLDSCISNNNTVGFRVYDDKTYDVVSLVDCTDYNSTTPLMRVCGTGKFTLSGFREISSTGVVKYSENSGSWSGASPVYIPNPLIGTPSGVTATANAAQPYAVSVTWNATYITIYHNAAGSLNGSYYAWWMP